MGGMDVERIYLDNASTTYPKPERVARAVYDYMTRGGVNINRGSYAQAYRVEEAVFEARQLLCELFHGPDCRNVVFTKNATETMPMTAPVAMIASLSLPCLISRTTPHSLIS